LAYDGSISLSELKRSRPKEIEILVESLKEYRKAEEQAVAQATKNRRGGQKINMG
jgi:hypothetical protein